MKLSMIRRWSRKLAQAHGVTRANLRRSSGWPGGRQSAGQPQKAVDVASGRGAAASAPANLPPRVPRGPTCSALARHRGLCGRARCLTAHRPCRHLSPAGGAFVGTEVAGLDREQQLWPQWEVRGPGSRSCSCGHYENRHRPQEGHGSVLTWMECVLRVRRVSQGVAGHNLLTSARLQQCPCRQTGPQRGGTELGL